MPDPKENRPNWLRLASIGFELAAAVVGCSLVGLWVDRHYGTQPRGVLIGALLGLVGGLYNLVREALWATRETGGGRPRGGAGD